MVYNCLHLLPLQSMSVSLGCVSGVIFILNSVSFIIHTILGRHRVSDIFKLIIVNTNISDMLCFLHLFILVIADLYYDEAFITQLILWKQSTFFHSLFVISLLFALMSPLIISFVSIQINGCYPTFEIKV